MEDFKKRVEKWRNTASKLHARAIDSKDSEECNYQLGKMAVCDMILKDIDEKQKETSEKRTKESTQGNEGNNRQQNDSVKKPQRANNRNNEDRVSK